ncbi:MAG: hypothetical protein IPF98_02860 [Gemmatimonadetes bacterium]|nr:hypothetical protein [Gemmatimonadota bacterium]
MPPRVGHQLALRITGKHKALFDVAEVESGYGVWRTAAWAAQYRDVMKVPVAQLSPSSSCATTPSHSPCSSPSGASTGWRRPTA